MGSLWPLLMTTEPGGRYTLHFSSMQQTTINQVNIGNYTHFTDKNMSLASLKVRGLDVHGSGAFGASRGSRTHKGIDLVCEEGFEVTSLTYGRVSKLGYPYPWAEEDKRHLRYVEVDLDGNRFRYFYINPSVSVGDTIWPDTPLGVAQKLTDIYPGITPHIHFEIIDPSGQPVNPQDMLPLLGWES
jgi:murein DD-endopeptidase MepM/ murein hydrolase activator NlpD